MPTLTLLHIHIHVLSQSARMPLLVHFKTL